ncbi:MAG: Oxidoreductase family, NAD-binding Rossmann fold [bacterium ADurb.Bin429]|nr:MAG: Oxidoreductase family, NAD-binding Rossmann fold [bacterium ADurb.Bin429]
MPTFPIPSEPLRLALIGAGTRARTIYQPLWESLAPWCVPVAVCDPVRENCDHLAEALGVPAYYDIRQLVRDRPMEAALVVTPIESHHSISIYLSSHGIHNHTETTWASMVCQAKEMITAARGNNVVVRVAENFFRMPVDRFAQTVRDSGYLGRIGRVVSYADHTGYHNNSRWIAFAQGHPHWVQCVEHAMAHPAFYSMPQRYHTEEKLTARFFAFPNDLLVMDTGFHPPKGHLGRHPRPGYTEWQGERGTLVHRAGVSTGWGNEQTELRYVSEEKLAPAQEAAGHLWGGGYADVVTPVTHETTGDVWTGMRAETPSGVIAYESPLRAFAKMGKVNQRDWYGVAVMDHVVDFVLAVRGLRASEFTDDDALMSDMMEIGARESALNEGRRVTLPIAGDLECDALEREKQRKQFGVDPLDVEAMLAVSFPRP